MLQLSPSGFRKGLLLAQVPENRPSFFTNILIAIPAKASAKRPTERSINFIQQRYTSRAKSPHSKDLEVISLLVNIEFVRCFGGFG